MRRYVKVPYEFFEKNIRIVDNEVSNPFMSAILKKEYGKKADVREYHWRIDIANTVYGERTPKEKVLEIIAKSLGEIIEEEDDETREND